jgi:hypothetical protein
LVVRGVAGKVTRPNSRYTERPQKVRMPPTTQRMMETPTLPVAAKIPDGVEKTTDPE